MLADCSGGKKGTKINCRVIKKETKKGLFSWLALRLLQWSKSEAKSKTRGHDLKATIARPQFHKPLVVCGFISFYITQ